MCKPLYLESVAVGGLVSGRQVRVVGGRGRRGGRNRLGGRSRRGVTQRHDAARPNQLRAGREPDLVLNRHASGPHLHLCLGSLGWGLQRLGPRDQSCTVKISGLESIVPVRFILPDPRDSQEIPSESSCAMVPSCFLRGCADRN